MQRLKAAWNRLPDKPRRILTLILGVLLIILSGLVGWIPGPGGTFIFLLGIAVLATEFTWAERLKDFIIKLLSDGVAYLKQHPYIGLLVIILAITAACGAGYLFYTYVL